MIKVNVTAIKTALKKTRGFADKTVILSFENAAIPGSEAHPLMLEASNGTAQSTIGTVYYGEARKEKYIVSTSIIDVIETISAFGEELLIEVMEGCLKLTCGDAQIPVAIQKDAVNIEIEPESGEGLKVSLKAVDFANLVANGGMATGDSTAAPLYSGTVIFTPAVDAEKYYLRALGCCGYFVSSAFAEVEVKNTEGDKVKNTDIFNCFAGVGENKQRNIAVNYASLLALTKRLVGEEVELFLSKKQLIVKDGKRDIYIFTIIEGDVAKRILDSLMPVEKDFEYVFDGTAMKNALAVVGLANSASANDKDKIKARLTFGGETMMVEDASHTSRAAIPAVVIKDNTAERALNAECLKSIASMASRGLKVYGPKGGTCVYFEGVNCKALLLPVVEKETKES